MVEHRSPFLKTRTRLKIRKSSSSEVILPRRLFSVKECSISSDRTATTTTKIHLAKQFLIKEEDLTPSYDTIFLVNAIFFKKKRKEKKI
jgi:hypothetical protein